MDYEKELQEIGLTENSEILQIIENENGETRENKYTLHQLVKALCDFQDEMKHPENRKEKFMKLNETQGVIYKDGTTEEWKQSTKKDYTKYKISNFGRIKYKDSAPIPQKDKDGQGTGWLVLDKANFEDGNINITANTFVYKMVADTWLKEDYTQNEKLGDWNVHHITNNGYDNSLENLILIRKSLHYKIHALAKNFNN